MEKKKKDVLVLRNPEGLWDSEKKKFIERKRCIPKCMGCDRMFTEVPEGERVLEDHVCAAFIDPKVKWRHHHDEVVVKKIMGKETDVRLHYNPCPLASHAQHYNEYTDGGKVRVGQRKQKKR